MVTKFLAVLLFAMPCLAIAQTQQDVADDAVDWGNGMNGEVSDAAEGVDPTDITPGYAGTDLPEASYYNNQSPGALEADGFNAVISANGDTTEYAWDQSNTPILTFSEDDPLLVDSWAVQNNTDVVEGDLVLTEVGCDDGEVGAQETTIERCDSWMVPEDAFCDNVLDVSVDVVSITYSATITVDLDAGRTTPPNAVLGGTFRLHGPVGLLFNYGIGSNGEEIGQVWLNDDIGLPADFNCSNVTDVRVTPVGNFEEVGLPSCLNGGLSYVQLFFRSGTSNGGVVTYEIEATGAPVETDTWSDSCLAINGCEIQGPPVCIEGPEERLITGSDGNDYPVYRDCWRYRTPLTCTAGTPTDEGYCDELVSRGCSPLEQECDADGTCVQTYECPLDGWNEPADDCSATSFGVSGVEFDTSVEQSGDFGVAAANLQAMEEAVLDMDSSGVACTEVPVGSGNYNCIGDLLIFNGDDMRCTKKALNFANCCSRSGWGLGWAADCSTEEQELRARREEGQCFYVGRYCSDDSIFGCLEKTETHCCFRSKLGRIIHEQGRPQIAYEWGSAEAPVCDGFSEEQLAALDFGVIDFSEYFADAFANVTGGPDNATMESIVDAYISTLSTSGCSQFDPGYPDC